jgi:hypothetical protein
MNRRILATLAVAAFSMFSAAGAVAGQQGGFRLPPLLVESTAFPDGGIVPEKYVFAGGKVQPDFRFSHAPEGTQSFAIIFHDLDVALQGGTDDVLHWLAWNIPATGETTVIPEGKLPEGSVVGRNITGQNAYMGPGAPPGPRYHHYVFEVYALNAKLDLPADTTTRADLLKAMQGKVVAKSAYVGRFKGTPPPAGAAPTGPPPR